MNPIYVEAIKAVLRWLFTFVAGYFVAKGVWTDEQAVLIVGAAATGAITLGLAIWNQYFKQKLINTSLALPQGSTQEMAQVAIKQGVAPPANIDADKAPFLKGEKNPLLKGDDKS